MKRSSIAAISLLTVYIIGAVICDFVLAARYRVTNLDDPFKNFTSVPVKSFTILDLKGGNGYAVEIRQGANYDIRLMNSRKSFFKMLHSGDTLKVNFAVANQTYQSPQSCTIGLIITVPKLTRLYLSGTNNIVGPFADDSLQISQDAKTFTRIRNTDFSALLLDARQESNIDLEQGNKAKTLALNIENKSSITMNGIEFKDLHPIIKDSARLIFFRKSWDGIKNNY